jgi:hypothetical protein
LARDFEIVYLTARPQFLADKTRVWLAAHGFPDGPLLTAPSWRATLRQERYKRRALARLREQLPNLLIGVGDKMRDVRAYLANHMLAIHIDVQGEASSSDSRAITVRDWNDIRRLFEANRALLVTPQRLRQLLEGEQVANALAPF